MDYSKLSDWDINRLVFIAYTGYENVCKPEKVWDYLDFKPNYCNNPSDAWPIIMEIKNELAGQKFHWYMRKDPLRAAMIVYLMMHDADKN